MSTPNPSNAPNDNETKVYYVTPGLIAGIVGAIILFVLMVVLLVLVSKTNSLLQNQIMLKVSSLYSR